MTRTGLGRLIPAAARGLALGVALVAGAARPVSAQSKLNLVGSVSVWQILPGAGQNVLLDFSLPSGPPNGSIETCCSPGDQAGVFALIPNGVVGTQFDYFFGPAAFPTMPLPAPLLFIGGFNFRATALGPGTFAGTPLRATYDGANTYLTLGVLGTVTGPGLVGPTPFLAGYSTQIPDMTPAELLAELQSGEIVRATISATFKVNPTATTFAVLPEPSTSALLATALVGLLVTARRRRPA